MSTIAAGRQNVKGDNEGAHICLNFGTETSALQKWKLDRSEDIYKSSKAEPLGKSLSRGHVIPLDKNHAFGQSIGAREKNHNPQAGYLINPTDNDEASDVRTHGDYLPGEQKKRNYDWGAAGIDPKSTVFGIVDSNPYVNGVAKSINPNIVGSGVDTTKLVNKVVEDFKENRSEKLGQTKTLGARNVTLSEDHTFGVSSRKFEEWGVGKLMNGIYTEAEQVPDADLGKSIKKGFRNIAPKDRVFGAPTVRTDIYTPSERSVADNNNYGYEPNTMALLYPADGAERGITEEDFLEARSRDEIKTLTKMAKLGMKDEDFDRIYNISADAAGNCSLYNFLKAKDNHH